MDVIPAWLLVVFAAVGEALFVFLVVWRLRAGRLRRRSNTAQDQDTGGSSVIEETLTGLLPLPLARYAAAELLLWWYLVRWISRRPVPAGSYSYHRRSPLGPLLVVVALTTPVEVLLFEVLLPWNWLRWLLAIAAVYAAVWVFGFYASMTKLQHLVEERGVRIRYGLLNEAFVPYAAITEIKDERARAAGMTEGLKVDREDHSARLYVGSRTDITFVLSAPITIRTLLGALPLSPGSRWPPTILRTWSQISAPGWRRGRPRAETPGSPLSPT
jgi:hypothetical protein